MEKQKGIDQNSICKSINALSIFKVIIRNSNPDEYENKFIFVGSRPSNIKNILGLRRNNA
jgi:hypothetical protein